MASLAEELMHTTVRLEGQKTQGTSVGTGFFFLHDLRLFLVTNKHVIEGVVSGNFVVLKGEIKGNTKKPILGQGLRFPFNAKNFIEHPDPNVDVAVMNVSELFSEAEQNGDILFWKTLTESHFPTQEQIDKFISPIEEVVFIGYPSGIWDTKNILPIVRKGITATPYYVDFDGQKKFLIDASVFPGSSGSPVFIYYAGGYPDKEGNLYVGNRVHFLGIIAQVYKRLEQGRIRIVSIPTQQLPIAEVDQMIDLGIVFKAETIKESVEHYVKVANASNNKIQPTQ